MTRDEAIHHAIAAHDGQVDKLGVPYILHPFAVAQMVAPLGEDFEVVALLHDVEEDTEYRVTGLSQTQRYALSAITRAEGEDYWDYISRVRMCFIARVVKVADIRHNLSPARHDRLPEPERTSLRERYDRSLQILQSWS